MRYIIEQNHSKQWEYRIIVDGNNINLYALLTCAAPPWSPTRIQASDAVPVLVKYLEDYHSRGDLYFTCGPHQDEITIIHDVPNYADPPPVETIQAEGDKDLELIRSTIATLKTHLLATRILNDMKAAAQERVTSKNKQEV